MVKNSAGRCMGGPWGRALDGPHFWYSDPGGLAEPGKTAPCRVTPRVSKGLQSRFHIPTDSIPGSPGHSLPALLTTGPKSRPVGTVLMLQNPLKLFRLVNSEPACPAPHVPICRNHSKGSRPCLSLLSLSPDWPQCFLSSPTNACLARDCFHWNKE